jgi:hypothetical protein
MSELADIVGNDEDVKEYKVGSLSNIAPSHSNCRPPEYLQRLR